VVVSAVERARRLLAAALAVDPATLPDDASLATEPSWDSLAHVRIMLAIEAERGAQLPAEEAVRIGALADIAAALGDRQG